MEEATLLMEERLATTTAQSNVKTILFHVHEDKGSDDRLEAALALARSVSAHVECLHVTPIQAYTAPDVFGGVFANRGIVEALEEEAAKLRSRIERKLAAEDVSWDYCEITGEPLSQLVSHAALADLVVTGRVEHDFEYSSSVGFLGNLLYDSRTPLLILSESKKPFNPEGPAVIAWNGSYEAANALRGSVGLLKLSANVEVLSFEEDKPGYFPTTRPLEYLSRHGIHAELRAQPRGSGNIAAKIATYAVENGASYIVMGGYSHSRAGQFIFGGVTRDLLKSSPVPLVIAR